MILPWLAVMQAQRIYSTYNPKVICCAPVQFAGLYKWQKPPHNGSKVKK